MNHDLDWEFGIKDLFYFGSLVCSCVLRAGEDVLVLSEISKTKFGVFFCNFVLDFINL